MNSLEIFIVVVLAVGVLVSYKYCLIDNNSTSYLNNKYWFGIPQNVVIMILVFQVLGVIGFIVALLSWFIKPPTSGILSKYLFVTLVAFFTSAIAWSLSIYYKIDWLTVVSLIFTALASIVLLVGSIEEKKPRIYIVLGLLLLCIVTVLCDAVMWNANFIRVKLM